MTNRDQFSQLTDATALDVSGPSLLGPSPFVRQDLDMHLSGVPSSGSSAHPVDVPRLLSMLNKGPLLGRGGAGFSTAVKIRAVSEAAKARGLPPVVVANGAEGEPLSVKDVYLVRYRPHLVLDGLTAVSWALGASEAHIYVADSEALSSAGAAIAERASTGQDASSFLRLFQAQETYVAGEESSVVRAIERGVARPTDKPPRPYEVGVGGAPTLVLNVETLAAIGLSLAHPGTTVGRTFLSTVSGGTKGARLYELPIGLRLEALLRRHLGEVDSSQNMLVGGFFSGCMPVWPDLELSHPATRARGGSLGCGSVHLLAGSTCPIKVAADVAGFYAQNTARQCGMCIASTSSIASALAEISAPAPYRRNYASLLPRWASQLRGRGACAVPDAVAILIRSILRFYPDLLARHFSRGCEQCAAAASAQRRGPRWDYLAVHLPVAAVNDGSARSVLSDYVGV